MALTAIALAASLSAGTCAWNPSTQAAYEGDVAAVVERFQDLPPALRERLRQRMSALRFDERVEIRRDAVLGAQRYAAELSGLQADRAVCALPDRSHWSAAAAEPALSYCEARHCVLVTLNGRHVLRATRTGLAADASVAGLDPQRLLDEQPTAAGPQPDYVPGRLLVGARAGLADAELSKIAGGHGGRAQRIGRSDLFIVDLPAQASEKAVAALLARHPHLKFAEQDQRIPPAFVANDPYLGSQWHLGKIGTAAAWDVTQGSGVTIAILDSGVDAAHPDLAGRLVSGWNFYDGNADTSDVYGHGTAVAGAAAATLNNGAGVAGPAGQARIMPLRVTATTGSATTSAIAQALTYAADRGARVANISFAASGSATVQNAAQYMKSKGGLVLVAAGNNGADIAIAPTTTLITVSATDANDLKASWSNFGSAVAIAAPGQDIWTTTRGGGYQAWWGTSLSSPVVAGVVGLMMAAKPTLSSAQVESLLFSTAVDLGTTGRDSSFGHGRVNAAAAVQAAMAAAAADTQPPASSIAAPLGGSSVSGLVAVDVNASDNVGVSRVELRVNGTTVATATAAPYVFSWDSSAVANGQVSLVARAVDAAGNAADSSPVAVSVANAVAADGSAPSLAIGNPAAGSVVTGTVSIRTSASDNAGAAGIAQTLSINGRQVASGSGASLSYSWNTRKEKPGSYLIQATARDAAGNSSTQSVQVSIK